MAKRASSNTFLDFFSHYFSKDSYFIETAVKLSLLLQIYVIMRKNAIERATYGQYIDKIKLLLLFITSLKINTDKDYLARQTSNSRALILTERNVCFFLFFFFKVDTSVSH